jgi:Flp pilus assembly pilin Flp
MFMMNRFRSLVTRLHQDERGQGLVEYVLVVAFLVLVATASMSTIADSIKTIFERLNTVLTDAVSKTS